MSDKFQFLLYTFTPYKNCRTLSNPRFFDQYPTLSVGQSTVPLSKALEDFEQINYNALLRGGEELWHLQPLVPVTSDLWAVWVGIMGFLLLTFIGALMVWRFRAKIFSFGVRGRAGGDRWSHEAELRRANEEAELRSRLVGEFSRLRREDEARTAAGVGSLASLVLRAAAENPEQGSADPEWIYKITVWTQGLLLMTREGL